VFFKRQIRRPTDRDAARRLVILKAVFVHAIAARVRRGLEPQLQGWTKEQRIELAHQAETLRDQHWGQVYNLGLWSDMCAAERAFAQTTAVTMAPQQIIDGCWRIESALTLLWALRMLEALPPYGTPASPDWFDRLTPETIEDILKSASLRPYDQIERARSIAELWHWRSRTRQLKESGSQFPSNKKMIAAGIGSFDDIVRIAAQKAQQDGTIPACINNDFPVGGKSYHDLTPEQWSETTSITVERHTALNWLCGHAPGNSWDKTPTNT
jgi:hypothetical protein